MPHPTSPLRAQSAIGRVEPLAQWSDLRRPVCRESEGQVVTTSTQESPAGAAMTAQPPAAVPNHIAAAFDRAPKAVASVGMRPVNAIGTVGRAARLLVEVLRFSITDALSGRLPVGELVNQAWLLYKVTALPAVLMAIPFGGM